MVKESLLRPASSFNVSPSLLSLILPESRRKLYYKELITRGDRKEILQTIHSLYRYKAAQMEAGKKFHLCDDNFLRDAEKLMSSEIALVLEMTMEQARDYLRTEFAA